MNNIILKSVSAENFAPFADKVFFTTEVDASKKESIDNTVNINNTNYNIVSYVFGTNGAGKSYFCKILREIQRLIIWSSLTSVTSEKFSSVPALKDIDKPVVNFAFDTAYQNKPTTFGIEIVVNEILYSYEFSILGKKIVYESLTKKFRRTQKLIHRISSSYKDIELFCDLKSLAPTKKVVKEEALCLPMLAFLNNQLAINIMNAILGVGVYNMALRNDYVPKKEQFSHERLEKYISVLKKADPTIRHMSVKFIEEETDRHQISGDGFEPKEIVSMRTSIDVQTTHAVYDNGVEIEPAAALEFNRDESLGTIKLFSMLPMLYETLENGGILVLDEIENSLHLHLVLQIIALFLDSISNPHNAQLICTSHQPLLVSKNTRRDQVWIIDKDTFGKSSIHRVSSFKTAHSKINISGLIQSAFGCDIQKFFD